MVLKLIRVSEKHIKARKLCPKGFFCLSFPWLVKNVKSSLKLSPFFKQVQSLNVFAKKLNKFPFEKKII